MAEAITLSLNTLPVEHVYRILDHLDDLAILISARNVCQRLNLIIETYHRYQVTRIEMVDGLFSDDTNEILQAVLSYRKIPAKKSTLLIDQVITIDIVRRLVQLLNFEDNQIQYEVVQVFVSLSAGNTNQTKYIIDADVVPVLLQLLNNSTEEIQAEAIWTLGNIAGDSAEYRDYLLEKGILQPLLDILSCSTNVDILRNASWCLSNLCRPKNSPVDFDKISSALPALNSLLTDTDPEILKDTSWAITYLCLSSENIQPVIESGVIPSLIPLLTHRSLNVRKASLRSVGNILVGNDAQTQAVIDAGVLPQLLILLQSPFESIQKETCWCLSNICSGTESQIQSVIDAEIFPILIPLLTHAERNTQTEAAWVVNNVITCGNTQQIKYVIDQNVIGPLCQLLARRRKKTLEVVLNTLGYLLKLGTKKCEQNNDHNPYATMIEESLGLDHIKSLQTHSDTEISEKASHLIQEYFRVCQNETLTKEDESSTLQINTTNHELIATTDEQIDLSNLNINEQITQN